MPVPSKIILKRSFPSYSQQPWKKFWRKKWDMNSEAVEEVHEVELANDVSSDNWFRDCCISVKKEDHFPDVIKQSYPNEEMITRRE